MGSNDENVTAQNLIQAMHETWQLSSMGDALKREAESTGKSKYCSCQEECVTRKLLAI